MEKLSKILATILINSLMAGLLITGLNDGISNFYTLNFRKDITLFIFLEKTLIVLISMYLLYFVTLKNYSKTRDLKTFTNLKDKNEFKTQHKIYFFKFATLLTYSISTVLSGYLLSKFFSIPNVFDNLILPINYLMFSTYGILKILIEITYFATDAYILYLTFKENIDANVIWHLGEKAITKNSSVNVTNLNEFGRYLEFDLLLSETEKYFENKDFENEKFDKLLERITNTLEKITPLEQLSVYSFLKLLKILEESKIVDNDKCLDIEKLSKVLESIENNLSKLTNEKYKDLYILFNLEITSYSDELEKLESIIRKRIFERTVDSDVVDDEWLIIREIILSAIFYNLIYAYEDEERLDIVAFLMDILYRYLYRSNNYELVYAGNYPYLYLHILLRAHYERFKDIAENLNNYSIAYREFKIFSQVYYTLLEVLTNGGVI